MTHRPTHRFASVTLVLVALVCTAAAEFAAAADLVRVLPVTDRILMLHCDEGHIDYSGIGEGASQSKVYRSALDTTKAVQPEQYTVVSPDDPNYAQPKRPVRMGRKSKGMEFRDAQNVILEHAIYMELPQPMAVGKQYTVTVGRLADNMSEYRFTFDPTKLRSDTVHVNQIGFYPTGRKYAYLSHWMGDMGRLDLDSYAGTKFHLIDVATRQVAFTGTIAKRKDFETGKPQTPSPEDHRTSQSTAEFGYTGPNSNFAGADVWECDFTGFTNPGTYRIAVDRIGCSYPFEIKADVYRDAFYLTCRSLYLQRAGIEKHVEKRWVLPRDYHPDDGRNKFVYTKQPYPGAHSAKPRIDGEIKTWGWYHDAGDWDTYPTHIQVPYQLLMVYDLKPGNFADGELHIPHNNESANGVPDILDEARWLLAYYRRTKDAAAKAGLGTGGVPGCYSGRDAGAHKGIPSWLDDRDQYIWGEDPGTTYNYAAGAAWLAHCLKIAGGRAAAEAPQWIDEARATWQWAQAHSKPGDHEKKIGAFKLSQSRMLAACMLYKVTGEAKYHEAFKQALAKDGDYQQPKGGVIHVEPWEFAATAYALLPDDHPGVDESLREQIKGKIVNVADQEIVSTLEKRGYRLGLHWYMPLVCGMQSTPWVRSAMAAYVLTGDTKYLEAVQNSADYFLGGNPGNICWVSQLGDNPVQYPFHCDSWYSRDHNSMAYSNDVIPGLVPYGSRKAGKLEGPWHWSGDEDFSCSTAYPPIFDWPIGEIRFENRWSIMGGEFTIHQNSVQAAMTYGFLCDEAPRRYMPNARPTVALRKPSGTVKAGSDLELGVRVSADTRRVMYYNGWRLIGEATEPPYSLTWRNVPAGNHQITAIAYDDLGLRSNPSPNGEMQLEVE